jgi:YfiH family protein
LENEALPVPHSTSLDRRELEEGAYALVSTTLESRGFLAAFTERTGGVSAPPFDTLNLGLRTDDARGRVIHNRRRLIESLNVAPFAAGEQVHGSRLARVGRKNAGAGFDDPRGVIAGVDALSVTHRNLPVAVLVADCLPIALASPREQLLVVVHAGWRGVADGILTRAVGEFERIPEVVAVIGPAIGPCHYEVGEEVVRAVSAGSGDAALSERRGGRQYLDLPGTAARSLRNAGLRHVEVSELCTACLPDRFFSYRRDGWTGRQALISMVM